MRCNTPPYVVELARECRKKPTEAEKILWQALRGRQLDDMRFYRQRPILRYVADFYCHTARLVVEVDGGIHDKTDQRHYDEERNKTFKAMGLNVLRVSNDDVLHNLQGVLEQIRGYNL